MSYGDHPAYTPPDYNTEAGRAYIDCMRAEQPVLWRNVFGEPVDLDSIDREYALNIYTMVVARWAHVGLTAAERDEEMRHDPLIQKLREVILKDAEKRPEDRRRAKIYNVRARAAGLRFRASTR